LRIQVGLTFKRDIPLQETLIMAGSAEDRAAKELVLSTLRQPVIASLQFRLDDRVEVLGKDFKRIALAFEQDYITVTYNKDLGEIAYRAKAGTTVDNYGLADAFYDQNP
jgi:hypothetical protein